MWGIPVDFLTTYQILNENAGAAIALKFMKEMDSLIRIE